MQANITLSKQEKRYQFLYLILMLFMALIFLGIIFLHNFKSPFSPNDILKVQTLEQKNKFDIQQKVTQPLVDSTFTKIVALSEETADPVKENQIEYDINTIRNSFLNANINDERKVGYPLIADFYDMFLKDKKWLVKKKENVKRYEKQYEECTIGYQQIKDQLIDRRNAFNARK
ncbi:type VI secretion system TssO [Chryseobacterium sp.]|uniref:type VI secretion system TssO n=1 Tax=Chryseobacterium sp. TaxID=1871047 RepID=UPI0028983CCF|nr:type VI secretion system TssO [Chryseobacterium sp.]